jgi:predicted Zn-ribbon and HTH transcriptional regulator
MSTVATMKKPIATVDRPDVNAAADFLEQLHAELTNEGRPLSPETLADRAWAAHRHARTLRRIACGNRSGHGILMTSATCRGCGATRAEDEVQP